MFDERSVTKTRWDVTPRTESGQMSPGAARETAQGSFHPGGGVEDWAKGLVRESAPAEKTEQTIEGEYQRVKGQLMEVFERQNSMQERVDECEMLVAKREKQTQEILDKMEVGPDGVQKIFTSHEDAQRFKELSDEMVQIAQAIPGRKAALEQATAARKEIAAQYAAYEAWKYTQQLVQEEGMRTDGIQQEVTRLSGELNQASMDIKSETPVMKKERAEKHDAVHQVREQWDDYKATQESLIAEREGWIKAMEDQREEYKRYGRENEVDQYIAGVMGEIAVAEGEIKRVYAAYEQLAEEDRRIEADSPAQKYQRVLAQWNAKCEEHLLARQRLQEARATHTESRTRIEQQAPAA